MVADMSRVTPDLGRADLSVCVITYNTEPALLTACLESVMAEACAADVTCQLVVVDNGSRDLPLALSAPSVAEVVMLPHNIGFGAAANRAVRIATADVVLLLNPDARLARGSVRELHSLAQGRRGRDALLCGWLTADGGVQVDAYRSWHFCTERMVTRGRWEHRLNAAADRGERWLEVDKVCGGALFARRSLLLTLGPFDEEFFLYGEDADLSVRATRAGLALLACPGVHVDHVRASSMRHYSTLVERARVDAALRLAMRYRSRPVSLLVRLELLVVTLMGLVSGGASSRSRATRVSRLRELWRWGLSVRAERFRP